MFVKMLFSFELSVNLDLCHEFKSVAKNILFFSFHSNFFYKKVFLNPIQLKSIDCVAPFRRHQCIWKLCFNIKWAIPFHASFFFIFVFSSELEVNKFPNDWIRTVDIWFWSQLFYQISQNDCQSCNNVIFEFL